MTLVLLKIYFRKFLIKKKSHMKNEDFGADAIDFSQDDVHVFRRREILIH